MNLGERLLNLRKSKRLSQEEVAEKLDVTRQTISKWETNQSTPDFDKIVPLCELYGITSDELLTGNKRIDNEEKTNNISSNEENMLIKKKRAKGIGIGVILYFIAVVWIMISIPVLAFDPIVSSAIFLLICGIATYYIIYTCIVFKEKKTKQEIRNNKLRKQIESILAIITTIVYLLISFATMAWNITWIIWIVFALLSEILKLIFMLRGIEDEE
jgi:transcriptional regulator with XRE-family HTH domain